MKTSPYRSDLKQPIDDEILDRLAEFKKHYGPNAHPSGSEQTAHAGKRIGGRDELTGHSRDIVGLLYKNAPAWIKKLGGPHVDVLKVYQHQLQELVLGESSSLLPTLLYGAYRRVGRITNKERMHATGMRGGTAYEMNKEIKTATPVETGGSARFGDWYVTYHDGAKGEPTLLVDKDVLARAYTGIEVLEAGAQPGKDQLRAIVTVAHEYGHALLHDNIPAPGGPKNDVLTWIEFDEGFTQVLTEEVLRSAFPEANWTPVFASHPYASRQKRVAAILKASGTNMSEWGRKVKASFVSAYSEMNDVENKLLADDPDAVKPPVRAILGAPRPAGARIIINPVGAEPIAKKLPDDWWEQHWKTHWLVQIGAFNRIKKHYGPGDHPSGTPQSVHRGGALPQDTLPGIEPFPHPVTKVTFRLPPLGFTRVNDRTVETRAFAEDMVTSSRMPDRDFNSDEKRIINGAVEEFEQAYPGALPEALEFVMVKDIDGGTFAFVQYDPRTRGKVFVSEQWFDNFYNYSLKNSGFVATRIAIKPDKNALDFGRQAVIFHELAHVADAFHGKGKLGMSNEDFYPFYAQEWYGDDVVDEGSWRLPSPYSTKSSHEYFAEALTDNYYNGEKAAPLSHFTAHQFRRQLNGNIVAAQMWAEMVKSTVANDGLVEDILSDESYEMTLDA